MSLEKTLIAQAKPHLLAARAEAILEKEVSKGCDFEVSPYPVALEPPYRPISHLPELLHGQDKTNPIPGTIPLLSELARTQLWLSPKQQFRWINSELFLKQLQKLSHRVSFEITGNSREIQMGFLSHSVDLPILQTAFNGQFEHCELPPASAILLERLPEIPLNDTKFLDAFPPPPYSHLITRPDELEVSTYRSLIAAMMGIEPPAIAFYQALFQPVRAEHNWHRNIQGLLDLEYAIKQISGLHTLNKYLQQAPSGDLRQMALDVETKAHNDKPFFSLAVRLGVTSGGENGSAHIKALSTFLSLFQIGGRPFNSLSEQEYKELSDHKIRDMFVLGLTYRSGFLVNSAELAGFVHIPPAGLLERRQPPILTLETLPIRDDRLCSGTPIGTCEYAGVETRVCIPPEPRSRSTHIIGRPGQTKSTTMAWIVLDDIDKGMGVAVLDPHGDLVESLLYQIKEEHIDRTIYFDPGERTHVPLWNPLKRNPGQSLSRTADDLVAAIKSVVTGWGDRLEHLLRNGIFALLHLPNSTLLDLSNLLRRGTSESDRIRKEIMEVVDNETSFQFWKKDFDHYSKEALDPPKHKLSKLLLSDTVSLMLSQPENLIDFRRIMDEGKILLINLSTIGSDEREILGCFMLSLFHLAALSRSELPAEKRKQFFVHVDEAHRFITEAIEDLISEPRKFGMSLTLAHHYLSQFGTKKIDALSSVGTTIIMNVDTRDGRYLTKDLQKLVRYDDLITLQKGEAIARIGTDIVRFKTLGALKMPETHFKDEIIRRSHEMYYMPASTVKNIIRQKGRRWDKPFQSLRTSGIENLEEFTYEEF
jgi:hypothetical protein